jgi:hypothetical protein
MFKQNREDIKDWIRNPLKWNYFTYIFRRPYYRWKLFKRFLKYPYYGNWELCNEVLDYSFEILCEFYENNKERVQYKINVDKESNDYGQKDFAIYQNKCHEEIEWLYNWYTIEKPRREEELEYLLHVWSEHYVSWWGECRDKLDTLRGCFEYYSSPNNKYADYLHKMLNDEEKTFEQEKEDALIRLVKIRNRLWS